MVDHGHLRRRVLDPRPRPGLGREDRQEVWRFYTSRPRREGHDTWPKDNDSWEHGGAPVWQTPAVDPELGLLYFSTGNASPDLDGSRRAGDNLFAASIVAARRQDGRVPLALPAGAPRHLGLRRAEPRRPLRRRDRRRGAQGARRGVKTGWLYLLDRETGKPLLPIEEKAVPQLAGQATAKTQPIPSYPPFFSHEVTDEDVAEIQKLADANAKDGAAKPKVVKGGIYTPFGETITAIVPGPQGGTNWQPTSYNPETGMFYVCAMRSVSGYSSKNEELRRGKRGQTADLGSVFTTTGFGSQEGHFLAIEASTGEIKWRKRWPESCYSGSVTTGGNLVFVGRNGGQLEAYNAETGEGRSGASRRARARTRPRPCSSRTGRNIWPSWPGAMRSRRRSTATTSGSSRSTGPWTRWPRAAAARAPAMPARARTSRRTRSRATPAQARRSGTTTAPAATAPNGTGANGGPNLVGNEIALDPAKVRAQVTNGGGGMPAFKDTLTTQQINDVTAYVTQEIATQ